MAILDNGKLVGDSTDETYHYLMEKSIEFAECVAQYDTHRLETLCRDFANELSEWHQITERG